MKLEGKIGMGGRNQEMALAAAIELNGEKGITFLSGGTDGQMVLVMLLEVLWMENRTRRERSWDSRLETS